MGSSFSKSEAEEVLRLIRQALEPVLRKRGIELDAQVAAVHPLDLDLRLYCRQQSHDGRRREFVSLARQFGLSKDDFGRTFCWEGRSWKLVGLNSRAPRNPVEAIMIPSGMSRRLPREALWAIRQARAAQS